MKTLILGSGGQVGRALQRCSPDQANVAALNSGRLDITDRTAVDAAVDELRPDLIINAAAYTAVDRAEAEAEQARRVNADAVGFIADAARRHGARLVHISTDFVFDGSAGVPYRPDAQTCPLNVYGRTKLDGERAAGDDALVVRTAWVYSETGANFVLKMIELMATRDRLSVVADQVGTPTYALDLAQTIWRLVSSDAHGVHHYTNSGVASWYDFAVAIQEEAVALGLLTHAIPILPIGAADYPTPARRPGFSVLDKSATWAALGEPARHWRVALRDMLKEVKRNG